MRNIHHPSTQRQINTNRFGIKRTRQRPGAFRWWTPGCNPDPDEDAPAGCTGIEPPLENNWEQPSPPLEFFAFRLHSDGSLEFKGHLDASGGASSGTVAVTLPGANPGEVDFRPAHDQFWHTTITTDDGTTFSLAMVFIDHDTGEVTITWPAT